MDYLNLAIRKLKPNAEWSITDNDYSTTVWHVLDGDAPTAKQIQDTIKQIKADEITTVEAKAAAKAAAQSKLAALGLTVEDLKALGL